MNKYITIAAITIIFLSIAGLIWWNSYGTMMIESAYNGTSIPLVNKYINIHRQIAPDERDLAYFLKNGLPVLPRLFGSIIFLQLLLLAGLRYRKNIVHTFFNEATHPVNLAIFRIILFSAIFFYTDRSLILRYVDFPAELRTAPPGLNWFLFFFSFDQIVVNIFSVLFLFACLTGIIGLYSRMSALAVTVLGFYILGIPQFFGKIDHYHHLLWFSAVLSVSRCGDSFSLDSFFAKLKNKSYSPQPSVLYQRPLRIIMVMMGVIYFFAGYWKFVIGGLEWGLGEPMKDLLYAQWFRLDWFPMLRIDQYPVLCSLAGVGVIAFEITFIFLIFFPALRNLAALGGILFHASVFFFAHINFWTLILCYVLFIDFEAIFRRVKLIAPQNSAPGFSGLTQGSALKKLRPVSVVGITLISINTLFGFTLIDSWPFAVYPTFASIEEKYLQSLTLIVTNPDSTSSEMILYKNRELQKAFRPSRLMGLSWQILWETDTVKAKKKGMALISVLSEFDQRLKNAASISLYRDICTIIPSEQYKNPLRREYLLSIDQRHIHGQTSEMDSAHLSTITSFLR